MTNLRSVRFQQLKNMQRNDPELYARYLQLPQYSCEMVVRCPTRLESGQLIPDSQLPGCGSHDVVWSGDVYDCNTCGLFFADYAADPPHQREDV